jgi:cell fate regulator YaaT (PSP1 superfamily)
MNVHDWLANLPFSDPESNCRIVEISFNNGSRKDYYRNASLHYFEKGEMVAVEGVSGFDVGMVSLGGELVRLQLKKKNIDEGNPEIKKILRRATEQDLSKWQENKKREANALTRSRAIARQLNLQMKLSEIEIQADGKKATFFYTADDRVDFRELIKIFASEFRVKVEMRQIGIRQEAAKVGGIGSCGRELCCSTWLTDFKSVNTTAARYQNLSINQTKLSGQCGRLKCCLNYELDTYLDALQSFPENAETIEVAKGVATLVKKDIFRNLMWYIFLPEGGKQYPLSVERVKQIRQLNRQGIKPDELQVAEIITSKLKEAEPEFVELVGQISLKSLERGSKRRKQKDHESSRGGRRGDGKAPGGNTSGGNTPGGNAPDGKTPDGRNEPRNDQRRPDGRRGPDSRGDQRRQGTPKEEGKKEEQRRPEGGRPEGGRPEGSRPEGGRPEASRPEGGKRDSSGRRDDRRNNDRRRPPQGGSPRNQGGSSPNGGQRSGGQKPSPGSPPSGGASGSASGGAPGPATGGSPA